MTDDEDTVPVGPDRWGSTPNGRPSIPGYQIVAELGRGGTGIVYQAWQQRPRRLVALKVLRAGAFSTRAERRYFEREAQAAAGLAHPGIVTIYEFGEVAGVLYFSMELVQGSRLDSYVEQHALSVRDTLALMQRVCEAVTCAHQHGMIHRDLKPSNILIDEQGEPRLLDFGTAKFTELAMRRHYDTPTRSGEIVGTVAYMAPEQTLGRPQEIDTRTDVYALGVILYKVLTGRLPHEPGDDHVLEVVRRIKEEPPTAPRKVTDAVDADVQAIVLRTLEKEKGRRYQSVVELAADIGRYLAGQPIEARAASVFYQLRKLAYRRRSILIPVCVALLAVVAVTVSAFLRVRFERNAALEAQALAEDEAYGAKINLAQARLREHSYLSAERLLDWCPVNLRHWEWGYLQRVCHPELRMFKGRGGFLVGSGFGPDGRTVLAGGADGTVRVWDEATGGLVSTVKTRARPVRGPDGFSFDGKLVVVAASDNAAAIYDLRTGRELHVLQGHSGDVVQATFSQDGKHVLTASDDGTARIWQVTSGRELIVLQGPPGGTKAAAFNPDGSEVATCGSDNGARLWDAVTGQELRVFDGQEDAPSTCVAFSPNGGRLATGGKDATAVIWDVASGAELVTCRGHSASVESVEFSLDGKRLLTASADKTARIWKVATGEEVAVLAGHGGAVVQAAFSRDGEKVVTASTDDTVRVWVPQVGGASISLAHIRHRLLAVSADGRRALGAAWLRRAGPDAPAQCVILDMTTGYEITQFDGHTGFVGSGAFSPNGERAATVDDRGALKVWNARTGSVVATLKGHMSTRLHPDSWSPDGERIVLIDPEYNTEIWGADAAVVPLVLRDSASTWAAFSPDGLRVVTAHYDSSVRVWDAGTGQEVLSIMGHNGAVWSAAFSRDGERIVTASKDMSAGIWDSGTGRELVRLAGHEEAVRCASFSPDSKRVVTAGKSGIVRIWDAQTGRNLLTLSGLELAPPFSAVFTGDGQHVVVAGPGQIKVYVADAWSGQGE